MIGTIDVKVQAHNPNFPLEPVFTFINSAQSFRIRNVPRAVGKWNITKVFIHLNYPDNTTISKGCVLNGNIWIGTVEGCATSGTSTNGFYVTASGIDENENIITNYVLGAGDLYVKDLNGTIDPDRTGQKMYFNDALPANPKKGDATFIDQTLNVYDGANWVPVAVSPDPSFIIDADGNKIYADRTVEVVEQGQITQDELTLKSDLPTKTSDLTNDSGFVTSADVPTKTSDLTNDSNFITTEEVKPFYVYDTSTGTVKPTEMATTAIALGAAYKTTYIPDKYAQLQPWVDFDPVELTPKFTLMGNYLGYFPWKLSKFFDQTYSPELELVWWQGQICRVLAGHFIQYYKGFMWRTKGIGFAIPCDSNGIPDGRLFEITHVEQTSPYRIGFNNTTPIHTITGNENWSAVLTIDEQENQITCTRSVVQRVKESKQTFPTLEDIPTSTSQLTNDSGFITSADIPTPSYIENADGLKIEADLDCTVKDLTLPWTLADGADTYTLNYAEQSGKWLYEEAETKKIELAYTAESSLWELAFYVWNNGEWQYNTGSTTTQEEDATSLYILDWSLTRSILKSDKLAKESDLPTKTSDLTNDSSFITSAEIEPYHHPLTPTVNTGLAKQAVSIALTDNVSNIKPNSGLAAKVRTNLDLTDEFTAAMSYSTYYPYNLEKYFEQTFSPSLELKFCEGKIAYLRSGRPRIIYTGYMFRTGGAGFAMPCSEGGTPDGRLYVTTDVQPAYVIVENETTSLHQLTFSSRGYSDQYGQVVTVDGQSEQMTCWRVNETKQYTIQKELANKSDLPTKTSDLSNDSGFITLAQVPTPSYIEDTTGNKISANLSCTYIDDTAWEITDPSSNKYVLEYVGFIQSYHTWECVEPENIKLVLTYANDWELQVYTWQETGPGGDYDWVLDINGSYNGDSDITTIPYFVNAETTYNYSAQRPVTKHLTLATKEYVDSRLSALEARIAALENNNQ